MLTGGLEGGLLWGRVRKVLFAPRRSHGLRCSGMLVPTGQSKEERVPLLWCPHACLPKPWHLVGGSGVAHGGSKAGKTGYGPGAAPCCSRPWCCCCQPGRGSCAGPVGAAPVNPTAPTAPIALPGARHSLSSCPVCTGIYICTHMCSGLAPALPSGHTMLRDEDKGPSRCASHSPTPAHGTRHTHPPQPFPVSLGEVWG